MSKTNSDFKWYNQKTISQIIINTICTKFQIKIRYREYCIILITWKIFPFRVFFCSSGTSKLSTANAFMNNVDAVRISDNERSIIKVWIAVILHMCFLYYYWLFITFFYFLLGFNDFKLSGLLNINYNITVLSICLF